eukprot:203915_1
MKQTALRGFVDGVGLVSSSNARTRNDALGTPDITISSTQPLTLQTQTASHCINIDSQSFIRNVMNKYLSVSESTSISAPAFTSYKFSLNDISQIKSGFDFSKQYIVGPVIGGGGDGTVHSLFTKPPQKHMHMPLVIKKIKVDSNSDFHLFEKLSAALQELHLINRTKIATLHALYYDARHSVIYKLYDRLDADLSQIIYKLNIHKLGLTEPQTRRLIRSLCAKLDVLHRNGYIHGDIKPSNILFGSSNNEWHLIDFDRVKYSGNDAQILSKFCGTFGFTAPELIHHGGPVMNLIDDSIDVWAIGLMIIWCVNGGHLGFMEVESAARDAYNTAAQNGNMAEMARIFNQYYNSIFCNGSTSMHATATTTPVYTQEVQRLYESNKISSSLHDLLCAILVPHPHKRLSASQVLKHEWFTYCNELDDDMVMISDGTTPRNFYELLIDPNTEHIAIDTQKTKALYELNTQCLQLEDAHATATYNDELLNGSTSYVLYEQQMVQNKQQQSAVFDEFFSRYYDEGQETRTNHKEREDAVFVSFSSLLGDDRAYNNDSPETMGSSEDLLDLLNGSVSYDPEKEEYGDEWHGTEEDLLCGCGGWNINTNNINYDDARAKI